MPRRAAGSAKSSRTAAADHNSLERNPQEQAQQTVQQLQDQIANSSVSTQSALQQLDTLLKSTPSCYPARLLRAQLRLQQGQAIPAITDIRTVSESRDARAAERRQARLLMAWALEQQRQYDDAQALITDLKSADAERLRQRIGRRQRGEPYLQLRWQDSTVMQDTLERVHGVTHVAGIFGVALRATGRPWNIAQHDWQMRLLDAAYEFVATVGGMRHLPGDPVLALRLISHPAQVADRGKLQIALLVRLNANSDAECRDQAEALWSMLRDVLPSAHDHVYSFEPVVDELELIGLLTPFELEQSAEIVRRQKVSQHELVAPTLYPLLPGTRDLHNLCWSLLRQKAQTMISVHLVPTDVMEWEHSALHATILGGSRMAETESIGERHADSSDMAMLWRRDELQWAQAQGSRDILDSMQGLSFVLRINVATGAGANPLIPEIVAAAMFAPVQAGGATGGYEIIRAGQAEEIEAARRNLSGVDVEGWGYAFSDPANHAPRLRYLVGDREAAYCFRLPLPSERGIPGVPVVDAKPVTPPVGLPADGITLGESVAYVNGAPLRITQDASDRRRHTYICGKTGVGKSTLLLNLALQDIADGHGVCVIDPHGDLIDDILLRLPAHRADDVIVFDPADTERPIGLNFLEWHDEHQKHQIVTEFIGLLQRMYDPNQIGIVGPRFQHNVRNAMLTAMCEPGNTLIEVVRVLTDTRYAQSLLPKVSDPLVRNYWEKQISQTSDFHKSEVLDWLVSKFNRFCGDSLVRNIIGQHNTTLHFREIMNERKVLLVKLSKGRIGPENSQFLGLLVVQNLLMTALSRADMPPDERPDFFLYVDEFQNFATELFATILSEGRKYGVAAVVANQYLSQLDGEIRDAIFGNVGSLVCFRVGTQDAPVLSPEMYPVFNGDDLLNLPRYTACVKLLVDGIAARPFTMRTIPDTHLPDVGLARQVKDASRAQYGQDAVQISAEILDRFTWLKPKEEEDLSSVLRSRFPFGGSKPMPPPTPTTNGT
ncbi:MAG: type IV secretion system DNA-binding domain-containing protein [Anaerolineae bacterium]|nr:type IV secretion system DNA-binding domain-containing protein [Anaerolineae bacterium]